MGTGIDKASVLAERYKENRGPLTAVLMGQPVQDKQLDAYSALRAMQILKETDRMALAQQARGFSGEQPSLAETAVMPDPQVAMMGAPVMRQQPQQAPVASQVMQAASGGLASMPTSDDDYCDGGIVAFASGGRPSSADYLKEAFANIPQPTSMEEREAGMTAQRDYVDKLYAPDRLAPFLEDIAKERQNLNAQDDKSLGYALLAASQAASAKPSTGRGLGALVPGLAAAGAAFGSEMQKFDKEKRDANRALRQSEMTLASAQQARDDGKTKEAISLFDKYDTQKQNSQKMLAEVNMKGAEIEKLKSDLARKTNREVFIDIQEVSKPDHDAQLVSESIALQLEKRVAFRRAMRKAVDNAKRLGCKGIKVRVSGRLNGAEIARSEWYLDGQLPLHTLRADVDYGFSEAFTTYGVIGVKVWIYKGEILGDFRKGNEPEPRRAPRRERGDRPERGGDRGERGGGRSADGRPPQLIAGGPPVQSAPPVVEPVTNRPIAPPMAPVQPSWKSESAPESGGEPDQKQ